MKKFDPRVFMASVRREAGEVWSERPSWPELGHLLGLEGDAFLIQAYRLFLHRDPDPAGMASWRGRAATPYGRLLIIASLWLSPERMALPSGARACLLGLSRLLKRIGR